MKLIVGLGNIGDQYKNTRHNLGFLIIDEFTKRFDLNFKHEASASYSIIHYEGEKIIFAKPNLFMNNSGKVIKGMMDYYNVDINNVLIFVDDKDQKMGSIKIVNKGGHGGQNGIRDIINNLKGNEFLRVKGGIGFDENMTTSNYVLGKWSIDQKEKLSSLVNKMADIGHDFIKGYNYIQLANKYHGK